MREDTLFDLDFVQRHFPLACCGKQQAGFGGGRSQTQMGPRIFYRGRPTRGIDAQFARHFANNPLATLNHKGFVDSLGLKRVKRQSADKHGHIAIDAVVPGLL